MNSGSDNQYICHHLTRDMTNKIKPEYLIQFESMMLQLGYDIHRHNVWGFLYYVDKTVQQYYNTFTRGVWICY